MSPNLLTVDQQTQAQEHIKALTDIFRDVKEPVSIGDAIRRLEQAGHLRPTNMFQDLLAYDLIRTDKSLKVVPVQ